MPDTAASLTVAESGEWIAAAEYVARRGYLPQVLSARVFQEIQTFADEFAAATRAARYALAMGRRFSPSPCHLPPSLPTSEG